MSFQSIVVGTDGSDTAKKAVETAASLAKDGGELHIVMSAAEVPESRLRSERAGVPDDVAHTVNPNEDTEAQLSEAAEPYESSGLTVHKHAKSGDPADAIISVAESNRADLIVVGNKGMTGAKRFFLGAVPNKISHHAPCSVLIVRTTQLARRRVSVWEDTTDALREGSPELLERRLLAMVRAVAGVDDRDTMMAMAPYHHCARRLGVDPAALFDRVAAELPPKTAALVRSFGRRRDIRERSFGFVLDEDSEGPFYRARR